MTDRRSFIKYGATLAALAGLPAFAAAPVSRNASLVIVDRSLDGSAGYAASAAGGRVLEFDSDVAPLWMNEVEPRLRAGAAVIAGYTSAATLFCVGFMARDYGACVVRQSADGAAVSWQLRTDPARRAALAPLAASRG